DRRGGPGTWRLRLREGVSGRADDARCQDHSDLRRHQRDPAPGDCSYSELRTMQSKPLTVRRVPFSSLVALTIGLGAVSLIFGLSESFPIRLLQGVAIFAAGALIVGGAVVLVMIRLAGWRDPESEIDFEALVQRTERLASEGG